MNAFKFIQPRLDYIKILLISSGMAMIIKLQNLQFPVLILTTADRLRAD